MYRGYRLAQGIAHKYNACKLRILNSFFINGISKSMTVAEISEITGINKNNVSSAMKTYHKSKKHLFRRLPKRRACGAYKWRINRYGVLRYHQYIKRLHLGLDLNLRHNNPEHMAHYDGMKDIDMEEAISIGVLDEMIINYITITKQGALELGLDKDKIARLRAAGLFREYLSTESDNSEGNL